MYRFYYQEADATKCAFFYGAYQVRKSTLVHQSSADNQTGEEKHNQVGLEEALDLYGARKGTHRGSAHVHKDLQDHLMRATENQAKQQQR